MSNKNSHDQEITQYLLGSLPEREAERLDELSFTDEEFAQALSAADKELVDAYARGELAGADLERFETHYLASPLRREKVEFAKALRDFAETRAAAEVDAGASGRAEAGRERRGWFSALNVLAGARPALRWGAGLAALALLAAGGWLAFEGVRQRRELSPPLASREPGQQNRPEVVAPPAATPEQGRSEQGRWEGANRPPAEQPRGAVRTPSPPPARVSVASFVLTPQVRAAGSVAEVHVPAEATHVAMRLELEPNEYRAYRVTLLDPSNDRTLWRSGRLRATAGAVGVWFRAGLLGPRVYTLRVKGVSAEGASEIVGDYPFRVVR